MAGYYCKFCHNFATIASPLTALLQKKQKFIWISICQNAFEKIKSVLLLAPVLVVPNFNKPIQVVCRYLRHCSEWCLTARGIDHPVCYFSKKFDSHQRNTRI